MSSDVIVTVQQNASPIQVTQQAAPVIQVTQSNQNQTVVQQVTTAIVVAVIQSAPIIVQQVTGGSGGGGGSWGSINGTLADQLDLQAALNGKYDASNPQKYITPTVMSAIATLAYAASIAPASAFNATYRIILTGNLTLNLPTGGADGDRVKLWLTASGADRVLTLNAGYKIPASSMFTSPVTIPNGKKAKLLLEYDATQNGGQWELTSFINGY